MHSPSSAQQPAHGAVRPMSLTILAAAQPRRSFDRMQDVSAAWIAAFTVVRLSWKIARSDASAQPPPPAAVCSSPTADHAPHPTAFRARARIRYVEAGSSRPPAVELIPVRQACVAPPRCAGRHGDGAPPVAFHQSSNSSEYSTTALPRASAAAHATTSGDPASSDGVPGAPGAPAAEVCAVALGDHADCPRELRAATRQSYAARRLQPAQRARQVVRRRLARRHAAAVGAVGVARAVQLDAVPLDGRAAVVGRRPPPQLDGVGRRVDHLARGGGRDGDVALAAEVRTAIGSDHADAPTSFAARTRTQYARSAARPTTPAQARRRRLARRRWRAPVERRAAAAAAAVGHWWVVAVGHLVASATCTS